MKWIKKYRLLMVLVAGLGYLSVINPPVAEKALKLTGNSLLDMLLLLPPIFILVGLLDQWIPGEVLVKYMGKEAGVSGLLITFLMAAVAAGPLYMAFPIATILIKKGASLRYVVFFLGAWSSVKLPVLVYEFSSFGSQFTLIHIAFALSFYYGIGLVFERFFDQSELESSLEIS